MVWHIEKACSSGTQGSSAQCLLASDAAYNAARQTPLVEHTTALNCSAATTTLAVAMPHAACTYVPRLMQRKQQAANAISAANVGCQCQPFLLACNTWRGRRWRSGSSTTAPMTDRSKMLVQLMPSTDRMLTCLHAYTHAHAFTHCKSTMTCASAQSTVLVLASVRCLLASCIM